MTISVQKNGLAYPQRSLFLISFEHLLSVKPSGESAEARQKIHNMFSPQDLKIDRKLLFGPRIYDGGWFYPHVDGCNGGMSVVRDDGFWTCCERDRGKRMVLEGVVIDEFIYW